MHRLRARAGTLLLALLLVGMATSAGATLRARSGCCDEMAAMGGPSEPTGPCHSLAPTSCCEERAPAAVPSASVGPALASAIAVAPEVFAPRAPTAFAPWSPQLARRAGASVVLRL
jgi:hypothetical protein